MTAPRMGFATAARTLHDVDAGCLSQYFKARTCTADFFTVVVDHGDGRHFFVCNIMILQNLSIP